MPARQASPRVRSTARSSRGECRGAVRVGRRAALVATSAGIVGAGLGAAPQVGFPPDTPGPALMATPRDRVIEPSLDPAASPSASAEPVVQAATGTFTGPPVHNTKGTFQLEIVVADGVVTDVVFLTAGTETPQSRAVNFRALPILEERILDAQSWNVAYVSGASFTSPAIVESARGAFASAGLG